MKKIYGVITIRMMAKLLLLDISLDVCVCLSIGVFAATLFVASFSRYTVRVSVSKKH